MHLTDLHKTYEKSFNHTVPYIFLISLLIIVLKNISFYIIYNPFVFLYRIYTIRVFLFSLSGVLYLKIKKENYTRKKEKGDLLILFFIVYAIFGILMFSNVYENLKDLIKFYLFFGFFVAFKMANKCLIPKNNLRFTYVNGLFPFMRSEKNRYFKNIFKDLKDLYKSALITYTASFIISTIFCGLFAKHKTFSIIPFFYFMKNNMKILAVNILFIGYIKLIDLIYIYNASILQETLKIPEKLCFNERYFYFFQSSKKSLRNEKDSYKSNSDSYEANKIANAFLDSVICKLKTNTKEIESILKNLATKNMATVPDATKKKKSYFLKKRIGVMDEFIFKKNLKNRLRVLFSEYEWLISYLDEINNYFDFFDSESIDYKLKIEFREIVRNLKEIEENFYIDLGCEQLEMFVLY